MNVRKTPGAVRGIPSPGIAGSARRGVFNVVRNDRRPTELPHAHDESGTGIGKAVVGVIAPGCDVIGISHRLDGDGGYRIAAGIRSRGEGLPLRRPASRNVGGGVVGRAIIRAAVGIDSAATDVVRVECRAGKVRDGIRGRRGCGAAESQRRRKSSRRPKKERGGEKQKSLPPGPSWGNIWIFI